jgi:PRTRC genetic system protein A
MALVEYLIARNGVPSRRGLAYDYVLAGDGLYLVSQNRYLDVRVSLAAVSVRGLPPIYPSFQLKTGRLPHELRDRILTVAQAWAVRGHEVMLIVTHAEVGGYRLIVPPQATSPTRVVYRPCERTVLEVHSHHRFPAYFSRTDDGDEQRLCLYGVIGRIGEERLEVALRVGAYGYYLPVPWESVFTGERGAFRDLHAEPEEANDDLSS